MGAALVVIALLGACSEGDGDVAVTGPTSTTGGAGGQTALGQTPAAPAPGRSPCADQNFTPNSEDIAAAIVAEGLSCADAEAFVRKVGPLVGATGGPADIEVAGFACVRTRQDDGLHGIPSADYECTSGDRKVTFHRT